MIHADSRYIDADLVPMTNPKSVFTSRNFPQTMPSNHALYTWKEYDRIEKVAASVIGDPKQWWKIMDLNPLIQSPHDIRPGQQIRVPINA